MKDNIKEVSILLEEEDKRKKKWIKWLDNYLKTNTLEDFISRLIEEHNEDYQNKCYNNGYCPYHNNKLELLFDYVWEMGEYIPETNENFFRTTEYLFGGYRFTMMCGQGTIHKDDKILLTI